MKKRVKHIVGIDESGRGSLAGPVTACAVIIQGNQESEIRNQKKFLGLKDSKQLTPKRREEIYEILKRGAPPKTGTPTLPPPSSKAPRLVGGCRGGVAGRWRPKVEWGIGRVSEKVIDRINILQATKLAMKRAVENLKLKKVDFLKIDGNFGIDSGIPQKSIIKGDEKVFLIKLASIMAKVTRDRAMLRYHKKYPQYRFDKHKGYGTKLHLKMLKKYGPCKIHRKTFNPVKYCKI